MAHERNHHGLVGGGRVRRGRVLASLAIGVAMIGACIGPLVELPEGEDTTTTSSGPSPTTSPTTSPATSPAMSTFDTSVTSNDPDATAATEDSSPTSGEPPGPFQFEDAPLDRYTQVDRIGFPLTNTFLNVLGDKDAYNAADPQDDAALAFAINLFESLETLHVGAPGLQTQDNTGLDDDLLAFGLVPCVSPSLPMDSCDDQIGPFAIPDVLTLDTDDPPGFPNGRRLEDPVADVILAVLLLDLEIHEATLFVDLDSDGNPGPSLDPLENDVAFDPGFPYLAPRHQ
jgi:hypothetical protein